LKTEERSGSHHFDGTFGRLYLSHTPQRYALNDIDVSIMAAMVECRDLIKRVRSAAVDYDGCDSYVDEIIEACWAMDAAIAGFVAKRLHVSWAWDKKEDKESIVIDWELDED